MWRSANEENGEQSPAANEMAGSTVLGDNTSTRLCDAVIEEGSPDARASRSTAADFTRLLSEEARSLWGLGVNVVTVGGDKRPNVSSWSEYQASRQSTEAISVLPYNRAYGIAGVCGQVSRSIACLDFDRVEGDRLAFAAGVLDGVGLPRDYSWLVITPGGIHIWIRLAGATERLGKLVGRLAGCDHVELRFNGHIAILPPSKRRDGQVYRYAYSEGTPVTEPAEVCLDRVLSIADWDEPAAATEPTAARGRLALASRTVTADYVEKAVHGELDKVRQAMEGHRNDTLFRAAAAIGSMLHLGLDEPDVANRLFLASKTTGLPEGEISNAIHSGLAAGKATPRDLLLRQNATSHEEARRPFPVEVLPEQVRTYVVEAAACVRCPVEMVAVPLLAYAAAAIGSTYRIRIKGDYEKFPVLWVVVIGQPGSGKSPADSMARSGLDALQRRAMDEYKEQYDAWQEDLIAWKQLVAKGQRAGKEPEAPVLQHFFTTDATIEALAPMLEQSPGIAASFDEIVGWIKSMDAYNGSPGRERAQYMTLWAERTLKVDRKTRPPIFVEKPVACVIGGVQPDMLTELTAEVGRRDGFIDRFLWAWPASVTPRWSEAAISNEAKELIGRVFERLRFGHAPDAVVELTPEAKVLWAQWYDANAEATQATSGPMRGVHAKADVHLARLALVLHVLGSDKPEAQRLTAAILRNAIELLEYHLAHATVVMGRLSRAANEPKTGRGSSLRQRILALLDEDGGWTSATDIAKGLGGHIPAARRDEELARMEAEGLVEQRIKGTSEVGGRPALQWRLYVRTWERADSEFAA